MNRDTMKHDCEEFETWIALDAEGDLAADESRELERHLASCADCRRFAEELAASQRAVRDHMQPPFDAEVLARVRAGVLEQIARPRARVLPFRRRFTSAARWVALAAIVLAALGLWWRVEPSPRETEPISPPPPVVVEVPPPPSLTEPVPVPVPVPVDPPPVSVPVDPPPVDPPPVVPQPTPAPPRPQTPPPVLTATAPPPPSSTLAEPMFVKLISEDSDLVIYWLVEPADTKEPANETPTVL